MKNHNEQHSQFHISKFETKQNDAFVATAIPNIRKWQKQL